MTVGIRYTEDHEDDDIGGLAARPPLRRQAEPRARRAGLRLRLRHRRPSQQGEHGARAALRLAQHGRARLGDGARDGHAGAGADRARGLVEARRRARRLHRARRRRQRPARRRLLQQPARPGALRARCWRRTRQLGRAAGRAGLVDRRRAAATATGRRSPRVGLRRPAAGWLLPQLLLGGRAGDRPYRCWGSACTARCSTSTARPGVVVAKFSSQPRAGRHGLITRTFHALDSLAGAIA